MAFNFLKKFGKNTLFYPGCMTKYVLTEEFENYKKILNKMKIDFITIPEELCCGSPVINAGYEKDARELARKNLELFKKYNVGRIITNCPGCYNIFAKEYPNLLPNWDIETDFLLISLLKKLKENPKMIIHAEKEKITYHDPCHLGRYLGIYDEPRYLLKLLGYEVIEMRHNKEDALCCGGGAGLRNNNPEIASKIAKKRAEEAKETNTKLLTTPCSMCFKHIQENSETETKEISHLILARLR